MALSFVWMAPFFSGTGYGTEAISYLLSFKTLNDTAIKGSLRQFAEPAKQEVTDHMSRKTQQYLTTKTKTNAEHDQVAICHSTPDVWLEDGAYGWGSIHNRCPPPGTKVAVGRTMYETDTVRLRSRGAG